MKKGVLLLLLLASTLSVNANNKVVSNDAKTGTISGKIIDATSKQGLPYVTIVVKDAQNKSITGGITDDAGNFTVKKIPLGKITIEISFIGYESISKEITLTNKRSEVDLGSFYLKESSAVLDEVVVVAETSTVEQKIDRKVINVGKDLTSAGTTASELLNNVQSVSVDSQSGNISLRGNENVRVLVDGKPTNVSAAQLLKQIPSTSIKTVELITNPSAKYNPEGMSGIINIILHKNANLGFNGSLNTGVTRGINTRLNSSINANFKTGKVNFFANYGYNDGKNDNDGIVIRTDGSLVQDFKFDSDNTSHLLKMGADYYINDKNTFSVYTIQNRSEGIFNASTIITNASNAIDSNNPNVNNSSDDSETYNINFTHEFPKKGENLEIEANFNINRNPENVVFEELIDPTNTVTNYVDDVYRKRGGELFNIDYVNPLSENAKLELGLEARFDDTSDDYVTTNTSLVNTDFEYKRSMYSAYFNYNKQINKLSMQIGARFEQFDVEGNFNAGSDSGTYKDAIFSVYPSAFLTYKKNDKDQYQLSYSRRVDRPGIGQVNPIRQWSTPLVNNVGNPELRPQFTNSYEFNYTRQYKQGSFSIGTFFREVNDNITRILNQDETNPDKVELSFINSKTNYRYGFEISENHKVANWWRINASADLYVQKESGVANNELIEVTNNAFNVRINNNFIATKKLRFQLFGMYRGGGRNIQFDVDPMWMVNTGASLNVLKGKGTISFRFNDIFKGMKFKFKAEKPLQQNGQFNWESRTAYLGFMYNFGGGKNRAKRRKQRDSNEAGGGGGFL